MPTPKPPAAPQIRDLPPMTAGRFRVILADPPWPYVTFSPKDKGRRAEAHYDTMAIGALPEAKRGKAA